jgi:hypothetical protein
MLTLNYVNPVNIVNATQNYISLKYLSKKNEADHDL